MESAENNIQKGKKRIAHPTSWKCNKRKIARVKGLQYISSKGKMIPAPKSGPPCRCTKHCYEKVGDPDDVFIHLYNMDSKDIQDVYLQGFIDTMDIARRRPRSSENNKMKSASFKYHVMVGDQRIEVCLTAFLSLHGIKVKRVRRLRQLAILGESPKDKRGKNDKGNALPEETNLKVKKHIESFDVKGSHYSQRSFQYLDSRLNIKIMYELFKELHPGIKISYQSYAKNFHENYNISFGGPQIDCCGKCEEFKTKLNNPHLNDNAKRTAAAELMVHKRKANKFYSQLKSDKSAAEEVLPLCFDFMQNIPLPTIPVQETYYMRQLTVNIFCIHNIKTSNAVIYLYHEGTAKKGPNEVCSFLLDYLQNFVPSTVTELHLYSDNCGGQNKNHDMARLLLALTDAKKFNKIQHYFPVRGHSFLPCDRDFGIIKRALKKHDRLYDLHQITSIVIGSSNNIQKFTVKEVQSTEVIDFKTWWPTYYKRNCISEETAARDVLRVDKVYFGISSSVHFVYDAQMPGTITTYSTVNGLIRNTFNVMQPGRRIPKLPTNIAYTNKIPIKIAKINDIKKLLCYIPQDYEEFYMEIVNWPTTAEDNVQDDA